MRTTLAQAKASASGIARIINIAACDPRFVEYVNNSQQRLADMGKWWGTYRRMFLCLTSSCIVWPRDVANPEGIRVCNTGLHILNEWYEFGEAVAGPEDGFDPCAPPTLIERANTCQFQDTTAPALIRIYPTVAADAGAKIILQGIDANGNSIRSQVGTVYIDGEEVSLAAPFATSVFEFSAPGLTGVQKPVTKGRLNVYAVDPDTGVETRIAVWEATEVNPTYRRSWMANMPTSNSGCCSPVSSNGCVSASSTCAAVQAEAIVRLEPIPAVVDTDWLFISNLQALRAGCKAVMHEERNQATEALTEWENAKRILRNELEKFSPNGLTLVNARPHGSADPRRIFAGMK